MSSTATKTVILSDPELSAIRDSPGIVLLQSHRKEHNGLRQRGSTVKDIDAGVSSSSSRRMKREYTLAEVAQHKSRDDALIIIDNRVYDVAKFLSQEMHPGGEVIWTHAGKDATDVFDAYHPPYVYKKKLVKYCVGEVKNPAPEDAMVVAYRMMHEEIKSAGLYDVQPWYWVVKCSYPMLMLVAAVAMFRLQSDSILLNAFAGLLVGLAQHQWAFIGHDGCHTSCNGVNANDIRGNNVDTLLSIVFATTGFGVSSLWWKYTHNQHHVVTNEFDRDPDVTHLPFYAVSRRMFLSLSKGKKMSGFELKACRFMVGLQQLTFFPIMLLFARASLLFQTIAMQWIAGKVLTMPWQPLHYTGWLLWADRIAVLLHHIWVICLFTLCPPQGQRLIAFAASWVTISFLHVQLVISHWERPMKHSSEEEDNWFVKQVVTGCNIEPCWWNEWFHGGLHFQVEHHLYPRVPRYNLRRVRDEFVQPFCKKWDIHYHNLYFFEALASVVRALAEVATHANAELED